MPKQDLFISKAIVSTVLHEIHVLWWWWRCFGLKKYALKVLCRQWDLLRMLYNGLDNMYGILKYYQYHTAHIAWHWLDTRWRKQGKRHITLEEELIVGSLLIQDSIVRSLYSLHTHTIPHYREHGTNRGVKWERVTASQSVPTRGNDQSTALVIII